MEKARQYLIEEAGNYADIERIDAYLKYGKEMVDFLEDETEVKFYGTEYPDYHMKSEYSDTVRSIASLDYHASKVGPPFKTLRGELPQTLFLGFAVGSSVEMKQFLKAGRSLKMFGIVSYKVLRHFFSLLRYGRGEQVVRGRALIGRLGRTLYDLKVPILLSSPVRELIVEDGAVRGAIVKQGGKRLRIIARRGVVLASGGFPDDRNDERPPIPPMPSGKIIAVFQIPATRAMAPDLPSRRAACSATMSRIRPRGRRFRRPPQLSALPAYGRTSSIAISRVSSRSRRMGSASSAN